MRILLAAAGYTQMTGGAEGYVKAIARTLARDHPVAVLTLGNRYSIEETGGVTLITLPQHNVATLDDLPGRSAPVKAFWHLRDMANPAMAREITSAFSDWKPDILHTHKIDGLSFSLFTAAARAKIPTIHTLHDYAAICPYAIMTCPYRRWEICKSPPLPCRLLLSGKRRAMRVKPDRVIAPSRSIASLHQRFGFFPGKPTTILRNGIPSAPPAERRAPEEEFHILYAGGLTRHKGAAFLLDLWDGLQEEKGITLHVAGDGPLKSPIEEIARRDEKFIYHGPLLHREVLALMAQSHLLLVPSLWLENCPLVIGEAARASLPVLASNIGGIPEFVTEGETGRLLPAGDAAAWKRAVTDLIRSPDRLAGMAAAAGKSASGWSMERHVKRLEGLYAQTLGEKNDEA